MTKSSRRQHSLESMASNQVWLFNHFCFFSLLFYCPFVQQFTYVAIRYNGHNDASHSMCVSKSTQFGDNNPPNIQSFALSQARAHTPQSWPSSQQTLFTKLLQVLFPTLFSQQKFEGIWHTDPWYPCMQHTLFDAGLQHCPLYTSLLVQQVSRHPVVLQLLNFVLQVAKGLCFATTYISRVMFQ